MWNQCPGDSPVVSVLCFFAFKCFHLLVWHVAAADQAHVLAAQQCLLQCLGVQQHLICCRWVLLTCSSPSHWLCKMLSNLLLEGGGQKARDLVLVSMLLLVPLQMCQSNTLQNAAFFGCPTSSSVVLWLTSPALIAHKTANSLINLILQCKVLR